MNNNIVLYLMRMVFSIQFIFFMSTDAACFTTALSIGTVIGWTAEAKLIYS